MTADERHEFFYGEARAALAGGFFFLIGAFVVWHMLGNLLGLVHDKFDPSPMDVIPFAMILGLIFMGVGIWFLWKSYDRRPVIVVDSEGLFYRPHGVSPIPWRDIRAVDRDAHSDRIVVTLHSGPRVNMTMTVLPEHKIYKAIMQAWQNHRRAA